MVTSPKPIPIPQTDKPLSIDLGGVVPPQDSTPPALPPAFQALLKRLAVATSAAEARKAIEPPVTSEFELLLSRLTPETPEPSNYGDFVDIDIESGIAAKYRNPGNLRDPETGEWRQFATVTEGFNALVDDIRAKQEGRTRTGLDSTSTLFEFFQKYAPPHENNTMLYTRTVAKQLGVTPATAIGKLDPVKLAHAVAYFEDRKYWTGVQNATKEKKNQTPPAPLTPPPANPVAEALTQEQGQVFEPDATGQVNTGIPRPTPTLPSDALPTTMPRVVADQTVRKTEPPGQAPVYGNQPLVKGVVEVPFDPFLAQHGIFGRMEDVESRREFLERLQAERAARRPFGDQLDGGAIGPAAPSLGDVSFDLEHGLTATGGIFALKNPKNLKEAVERVEYGFRAAHRFLSNLRFMANGSVLSGRGALESGTGAGVDVGGLARFGDQMLTPMLEAGFKDGFHPADMAGEFFKTAGQLGYGIADMFVGMPIKLIYNEMSDQSYLLPEERETMFKQTLANYAGMYLGLKAGNVFANRRLAMFDNLDLASPMSELSYVSRMEIPVGFRAKLARGAVEGFAGGFATGALEGTLEGQEHPLDLAFSYALLSVPLGLAFEAIIPDNAARMMDTDGFNQYVAQQMFHLRQLEFTGNTTADQAVARMFSLAANPNDLGRAVLRAGIENGDPVIVRGVTPEELLKGMTDEEIKSRKPVFFKNPDGSIDMLVSGANITIDGAGGEVYHYGTYEGGVSNPHLSITGENGRLGPGLYMAKNRQGMFYMVPNHYEFGKKLALIDGVMQLVGPDGKPRTERLRAFRIADDAKIFDKEGTPTRTLYQEVRALLDDAGKEELAYQMQLNRDVGMPFTNDDLYYFLQRLHPDKGQWGPGLANEWLGKLGYDAVMGPDEINFFKPDADKKLTPVPPRGAGILTDAQRMSFEQFGHYPGEHVSWAGNDYIYVKGEFISTGKGQPHLIEHTIKASWGEESFTVRPGEDSGLQRGFDIPDPAFAPDAVEVRNAIYRDFKRTAPNLFDAQGNLSDIRVEGNISFDKMFSEYIKTRGIPVAEYNALSKFLQEKLAEDMTRQALDSQEYALYQRLSREAEKQREAVANNLPELANANGMYVDDSHDGGFVLRDEKTHEILYRAQTPELGKRFIEASGRPTGPDLGVAAFPGVGSKLGAGIKSNLAYALEYDYTPDGVARRIQHYLNTTWVGRHFTGMRQVLASMDALGGTQLVAEVWAPLNEAFMRKFAAMNPEVLKVEAFARMLQGLSEAEVDHLITLQETRSAAQIVNGELLNRPLTSREIAGADWLQKNRIDVRKAYEYRRAAYELEKKFGRDPNFRDRLREVQAKMNVDEAHIEAARIMDLIMQKKDPANLSLYAITRLAEALMGDHLTPAEYAKKNKLSPQVMAAAKVMDDNFKGWANLFDIPEEQRLSGYFAHQRKYTDLPSFEGDLDATSAFLHDLYRTGEMDNYSREPVDVMMRYLNLGFNEMYTNGPWDAAIAYLDKINQKLPGGKDVAEFVKQEYMYDLRGIHRPGADISNTYFKKLFDGWGLKIPEATQKQFVNSILSLISTKYIGFRPIQAVRDVTNILQMKYALHGIKRTTDMITAISRWTPEMAIAEGIIAEIHPGESVMQAMSREGVIPTLSPISVLSGDELRIETLAGKSAKVRQNIQALGNAGLKWGGQHNAYQWGHAANYLEAFENALGELSNMGLGKYGDDLVVAKRKAYDKMNIDQYDTPIIEEFDGLVRAGQFKQAAQFIARQASFDVVSILGLSNNPAGWNSTGGRLFAQFGNWPVQMRSTVVRLGSRGSPRARAAAVARYGMSQVALGTAAAAAGLSLAGWFLPYGHTLAKVGEDIGDAVYADDSAKRASAVGRAVSRTMFGLTLGESIFSGGPLASMLQSAQELANTTDVDDAQAAKELMDNWLLGSPMPLVLSDVLGATEYASRGMDPFHIFARAFGARANKQTLDNTPNPWK